MPLHAMYVNQGAQGCDMKLTFAVIFTLLRKKKVVPLTAATTWNFWSKGP